MFNPIKQNTRYIFGAITICCRDCAKRVNYVYAIDHNWQTCETEINPDQTRLDYMCPDCVESLTHEINELIATQANDVNGDQS